MSFDLLLTLGVLAAVFGTLVMDLLSADAGMLAGLVVVVLGGIIELDRALQGFTNSTLLALGTLYVVAGLRETGALDIVSSYVLGEGTTPRRLLLRMCPSVTLYSAFLNNTSVVAMGIPAIRGWCKRHGVSPSTLLMPLSFAAILGGICTLIETSTNLVTHGLLQSHGMEGFGFFELAWVGVPCAVIGLAYVIFVAPTLTPERVDIREEEEEERADLIEVELAARSLLVGETVQDANLKLLPGLTLIRIERGTEQIAPVQSDETLYPGDRLLFVTTKMGAEKHEKPAIEASDLEHSDADGQATGIEEYERVGGSPLRDLEHPVFPGLRLAYTDIEQEEDRELHQVVVREGSSLIGEEIGDIPFRQRFGAALTGMRRGGKRLEPPFPDVRVRPGDVLLLDTRRGFRGAHETDEAFVVTSEAGGEVEKTEEEAREQREEMRPHGGGWQLQLAVAVVLGIVGLVAAGVMHTVVAGLLGAFVLIAAGIPSRARARGGGLERSHCHWRGPGPRSGHGSQRRGQDDGTGHRGHNRRPRPLRSARGTHPSDSHSHKYCHQQWRGGPHISNCAVFGGEPGPLASTLDGKHDPRRLNGLHHSHGYQTNLMVYGPGSYRFLDFTRVGGVLQVLP